MRPAVLFLVLFGVSCDSGGVPRTPLPSASGVANRGNSNASPRAVLGLVKRLEAPRRGPHAYGKPGDLELRGTRGASLVVAASPDRVGQLPVQGSIVDATTTDHAGAEPLFFWRPAWVDKAAGVHPLVASLVVPTTCASGPGIETQGNTEGVRFRTRICAEEEGRFSVHTRAEGLPEGAHVGDQMNPGSARVLIDGPSVGWEGENETPFVALLEDGLSLVFASAPNAPPLRAKRGLVHITTSLFPGQVVTTSDGPDAVRTLTVRHAPVLDLLAPYGTRTVSTPAKGPGNLVVYDPYGNEIERLPLPLGAKKALLPPKLGAAAALLDASDVPYGPGVPIPAGGGNVEVTGEPPARTTLELHAVDETGAPLPVHAIVRGVDGTQTPRVLLAEPSAACPHVYAALSSVYAMEGCASLPLPRGNYEVVVSHGTTHTLEVSRVTAEVGKPVRIEAKLRRVVDTSAWTSCDFHLHAAPSPDAPMSLEARVATLAGVGVELAVATDHNAITDYGPAVRALGIGDRLATVVGDEITSQASPGKHKWGHFNAFPLKVPSGGYDDGLPAYFDTEPRDVFKSARAAGALLLQVNHARMDPQIGYLDLVHFDAKTGKSDDTFADGFDLFEVFNGLWLTKPEKVREGMSDVMGLLRRGVRVVPTGNSDSHKLFFEEAGYPRTFVHGAALPREGREARVLEALKRGEVTVSSGPFVELTVDKALPGATVPRAKDGFVTIHVRVSAPAWVPFDGVDIIATDDVVKHLDATSQKDGVRLDATVRLPIAADAALFAWATAKAPLPHVLAHANAASLGFSGVVYVDADGDGHITLPPVK